MVRGVRNREEAGYGDKQWGGHGLTPLSLVVRLCILWADQSAPALPAAVSLQLSVTGPGERGREKSQSHLVQSDQRGPKWGGHVSLCISDKTARPTMTLCPVGIACFSLFDRDGLHFLAYFFT